MKYIIETYTICDGWINTWSDDDGPTVFDSKQDAEIELSYFLQDEMQEYKNGNIAGLSDPDDFRIVELSHAEEA